MSGKNQYLFAEDQQIIINEKLKLEQFKSIFISTLNLMDKLECSNSDLRTLTFSKVIIRLDEDICFKFNPDINLIYTNQHPKILKIEVSKSAKELNFDSSKNFINA